MREIKFRGLTSNKEWVYGLISKDTEGSTAYYTEMPYRMCWFEDSAHCNQPVITNTIGEFTGLCDKKHTPIYEGDICKDEYGATGIIEMGVGAEGEPADVMGSYYGWCFSVPSNAETGFLDGDLTVIGNICDNPELIK